MEIISFASEGKLLQGTFFTAAAQPALQSQEPGQKAGEQFPSDKAVIVCHGAFESRENWSIFAQRLADQGFATLVFDFVGHGGSEGSPGLVDMRQWAYNIRDAMTALGERGFQRFALVGWGSGGSAALLAAAHDLRLVCLAVLAAPIQLTPPLNERTAYTLATGVSKVWKVVKKRPLTLSREQSFGALRFAVDDTADAAYKENLRLRETWKAVPIPESLDAVWLDISKAAVKIMVPVLIIHGARDAVVPVKQSEKLLDLLHGPKELMLVEDAGHALHFDQKQDEVFQAIARWIHHYLIELA